MLSFFPRDVLDEILNLIESVSEVFLPTLSCRNIQSNRIKQALKGYIKSACLRQVLDKYR